MKNLQPFLKKVRLSVALVAVTLSATAQQKADLIIYNGKIATMATPGEFKQAIAMQNGLILATGTTQAILHTYQNKNSKLIDAGGKTVIPGLNDSHMHAIREGLNFNMELRW